MASIPLVEKLLLLLPEISVRLNGTINFDEQGTCNEMDRFVCGDRFDPVNW